MKKSALRETFSMGVGGVAGVASQIIASLDSRDPVRSALSRARLVAIGETLPDAKKRMKWMGLIAAIPTEKVGPRELREMFVASGVSMGEQKVVLASLQARRRALIRSSGVFDYARVAKTKRWRAELLKRSNRLTEHVVYSGRVVKFGSRGQRQPRVLVITNRAMYLLLKDSFACRRRVPLDRVSLISMLRPAKTSAQIAIHVPSSYDLRMEETAGEEGIRDAIQAAYKSQFKRTLPVEVVSDANVLKERCVTRRQLHRRPSRKSSTKSTRSMTTSSVARHSSLAGRESPTPDSPPVAALTSGSHPWVSQVPDAALLDVDIVLAQSPKIAGGGRRLSAVSHFAGTAGEFDTPVLLSQAVIGALFQKTFGSGVEAGLIVVIGPSRRAFGCLAMCGRSVDGPEAEIPFALLSRAGLEPGGRARVATFEGLGPDPWLRIYPIDDLFDRYESKCATKRRRPTSASRRRQAPLASPWAAETKSPSSSPGRTLAGQPTAADPTNVTLTEFERELLKLLLAPSAARHAYRSAFRECYRVRHWEPRVSIQRLLASAWPVSSSSSSPLHRGLDRLRAAFLVLDSVSHAPPRVKSCARGVFNFQLRLRNVEKFSPLGSWAADACHERQYRVRAALRAALLRHISDKSVRVVIEAYCGRLCPHFMAEAHFDLAVGVDGRRCRIIANELVLPEAWLAKPWEERGCWMPLEFYSFLLHTDVLVLCSNTASWQGWAERLCDMRLATSLVVDLRDSKARRTHCLPRQLRGAAGQTRVLIADSNTKDFWGALYSHCMPESSKPIVLV